VQTRTNNHGICFHGTKATLVLDRNGHELYADRDPTKPVEQQDNSRRYRDGKPGNEVDGPWQRLFVAGIDKARSCLSPFRSPMTPLS